MLILTWSLIFHVNNDSCLFRLESIFALINGYDIFDSVLRCRAFSPAKIIYKGFTRYGNACILIESVHRPPRENTDSAGKPRNSSISFFTNTRWSNDYSKLVRIIKLCCSLLSARY